jgi:hypothetical protein
MSPESSRSEADEGALSAVAKGLAEHKVLLYGFGVILAVSATCQILRTDFVLYLWIVFAIYLAGSMIWVITRDRTTPPGRAETSTSSTTVLIEGSERVKQIANSAGLGGNKDVTVRNSKDVEEVANDKNDKGAS